MINRSLRSYDNTKIVLVDIDETFISNDGSRMGLFKTIDPGNTDAGTFSDGTSVDAIAAFRGKTKKGKSFNTLVRQILGPASEMKIGDEVKGTRFVSLFSNKPFYISVDGISQSPCGATPDGADWYYLRKPVPFTSAIETMSAPVGLVFVKRAQVQTVAAKPAVEQAQVEAREII